MLIDHLAATRWRAEHDPRVAWVINHGRHWPTVSPRSMRGRRNACFANALRACDSDPSLRYVEGYAAILPGLDLTFSHAWVVDAGDIVHELTWEEPSAWYFGVEFGDALDHYADMCRTTRVLDSVVERVVLAEMRGRRTEI